MGDAEATVRLFEKCLSNDKDNFISKSLKKNSRESTLPPNLPIEVFNELPEKTGVYYFHNLKGEIIYVGKAINIRKRILSHFSGSTATRLSFISSIANISHTICGTELIALLLESSEIKRLFPIYNQAQKFDRSNYILTEYTDQKGIKHLIFTRHNKRLKAITYFRSFDAGREFVFRLIKDYNLCPKYCGLHSGAGPCLDHKQNQCKGICIENESVAGYNERVNAALEKINRNLQTNIIIDEGRTSKEKSVVLVEEGIYKGFGYFDSNLIIDTTEKAREIISPFKHNPDVQRILEAWY
jgi:DNA polymerase-3 subunit epsilon